MPDRLTEITEEAALRNPETAFERGWRGGRNFERERCVKIAQQTAEYYGEPAVGSAIKNAIRNADTKIRKE